MSFDTEIPKVIVNRSPMYRGYEWGGQPLGQWSNIYPMTPKPTGGTVGGIPTTAAPPHPNPVAPTHLPPSMDAWYEHFLGRKREANLHNPESDQKLVHNQTGRENELIYFLALSEEYRQKYPEAKQFVHAIYKHILRRGTPPTDAEIAGHLAKLAGNTREAREQVLNDILGCPEYTNKPLLPPRPTQPQPEPAASAPRKMYFGNATFQQCREAVDMDFGGGQAPIMDVVAAACYVPDKSLYVAESVIDSIGDGLSYLFTSRNK